MRDLENLKKLSKTRLTSKTPKFFRIVRNIGLVAASIGLFVAKVQIDLPATIITAGGYFSCVGAASAVISQFAKE